MGLSVVGGCGFRRSGLDGTLLGPEETGPCFSPAFSLFFGGVGGVGLFSWAGCGFWPHFWGWGLRCGLFFEFCIVDASIFFVLFVLVFSKLLRAHGGCLGIRVR